MQLRADQLEAQLAPVSDVLFAAAALASGEVVLDVGCGRGATTRQAAAIVGAEGTATGLDVSEELLAAAQCPRSWTGTNITNCSIAPPPPSQHLCA